MIPDTNSQSQERSQVKQSCAYITAENISVFGLCSFKQLRIIM